jgi:hypothetical protein
MPLSNYARDNFIAPGFSNVTECRLRSVTSSLVDCRFWAVRFTMTDLFTTPVNPDARALAFAIVRRAEGAAEDLDAAAEDLDTFVRSENKSASLYFRVLRKLHNVVAQTYQAMERVRGATGINHHTPGDGSRNARLALVYNTYRHGDPLRVPAGNAQVDWLTNEGLHVEAGPTQAFIGFEELRDAVLEIGLLADKISRGQLT